MSWHATARSVAQRAGLDPRYVRRFRWITKTRAVISAGASLRENVKFIALDPETANFTYELANADELASWVAAAAHTDKAAAQAALDELRTDDILRQRLRAATRGHWLWSKRMPPYGKRAGWYALARLIKPRLAIETGVHDGLGSLLLLRALERNSPEGSDGRLVAFDVNPAAGWLVGADPRWDLRIEPSRAGLESTLADGQPLGLFIHDSLHTYENERFELATAARHLAPGGVLVSDNVHGTSAFADTCSEFALESAVFQERSLRHFYRGGAFGAAWAAPLSATSCGT
jgi:predicted O-methyltransferase YrrM